MLPEYPRNKLENQGIKIKSVELKMTKGRDPIPTNLLLTCWQKSKLDMSTGLDFGEAKGPIYVSFVHLQHVPFKYNISVSNTNLVMTVSHLFLISRLQTLLDQPNVELAEFIVYQNLRNVTRLWLLRKNVISWLKWISLLLPVRSERGGVKIYEWFKILHIF